jgi:hypothetical protein
MLRPDFELCKRIARGLDRIVDHEPNDYGIYRPWSADITNSCASAWVACRTRNHQVLGTPMLGQQRKTPIQPHDHQAHYQVRLPHKAASLATRQAHLKAADRRDQVSAAGGGAAGRFVVDSVSALALTGSDADFPASCRFRRLSRLKSVSYQPPPLRRNAAALKTFFNADWPHCGHSTSGASLIFCSTSSSWPQDSQRYS